MERSLTNLMRPVSFLSARVHKCGDKIVDNTSDQLGGCVSSIKYEWRQREVADDVYHPKRSQKIDFTIVCTVTRTLV